MGGWVRMGEWVRMGGCLVEYVKGDSLGSEERPTRLTYILTYTRLYSPFQPSPSGIFGSVKKKKHQRGTRAKKKYI